MAIILIPYTSHELAEKIEKNSWREKFCKGCWNLKNSVSRITHHCPNCYGNYCEDCVQESASCPRCSSAYTSGFGPR